MNGRLPLLGLALLFAGTASGATVQDHRCLTGGRNGSIHLEWRWLEDGQSDVRYAGQRKRLPAPDLDGNHGAGRRSPVPV